MRFDPSTTVKFYNSQVKSTLTFLLLYVPYGPIGMLIESVLYSNQPLSAGKQAFKQDFEIGSPNFMWAEDAMLLGGSGGMLPQKILKN